ncbi:MAG: hypothetical protein CM1200mP28_08150 [Deltaproteobacteria bacterium]|nr:MAG: hypothetical protein CM1200mP28_08150 [Deltaproteobacteria bacterium]
MDTWKAEVARQSLDAGADAVNDVSALRADKEKAGVIAEYQSRDPKVLQGLNSRTQNQLNTGM